MTRGIFSIGKANPDKNIIGIITPKPEVIIACACVLEIVDMYRLKPSVDNIYNNAEKYKKKTLPFIGI